MKLRLCDLARRVDGDDEAEVARHISVEQCVQRRRDVDSEAFLAQHLGEERGERFGLMPLPATPEYERAPTTSIVPRLLEGIRYTRGHSWLPLSFHARHSASRRPLRRLLLE